MSKPLFDASDESEHEAELQLGTNKEYANAYNSFRKKELLKKFKDRGYNDIASDDSSEDSESSDEDDDKLDETFDREFFKTLASLKSKDPAIYDKNTQFFASDKVEDKETTETAEQTAKKTSKPITLKDYERKVIVEHGGRYEDDSDAESVDIEKTKHKRAASPTAVEEEQRLKAELKQALDAEDSADEEFGGIFKKRVKSREEKTQEETDFAEWLAGKKADIEASAKQKLEPLKNYWNQRNLPQSERFLRDYILNKGYSNSKSTDIPTYAEIVGDENEDDDDGADRIAPKAFSDDEHELEKQAEFEEKYNFRFEEPDAEFIKRFPRTIEHSVRQDDGKRKEKRQELKQRKQAEKEQKMKELEMLKEIKRTEILEKIEKLKKVTGNDELGFKDEELEEDFDPEAHDRRMREIFNDDYYQVDEGEEKPECPSDIDELKTEDWDNYDPQKGDHMVGDDYDYDNDGGPHCEDDDFNMDCDYDAAAAKQQMQQELIDNTKKRKNRRGRRNRFMEMIQQTKPAFDPEDERTYGEYIDEYYKMDCEDIIGDLPCRFKYVETTPNDFGLTVEEILLAKNKELNQWASLKKALQIRPDHVEKRDQRLYKMKAKNEALKRKIFKSLYGETADDDDDEEEETPANDQGVTIVNKSEKPLEEKKTTKKNSKRKRKNEQNNDAAAAKTVTTSTKVVEASGLLESKESLIEGTSAPQSGLENEAATVSETTMNATQSPKKKRRKNSTADTTANTATVATPANDKKKKKKNKKKKPQQQQLQQKQPAAAPASSSASKPNAASLNVKASVGANDATPAAATTTKTISTAPATATPPKSSNPFNQATAKLPTNQSTNQSTNKSTNANPFKAATRPSQPKFANDKLHGKLKINGKSKPNFKSFDKKKQLSKKPFGRRNPHAPTSGQFPINDERLKAYNINPRKFHKKQKFGGSGAGGGGGGGGRKQKQKN